MQARASESIDVAGGEDDGNDDAAAMEATRMENGRRNERNAFGDGVAEVTSVAVAALTLEKEGLVVNVNDGKTRATLARVE